MSTDPQYRSMLAVDVEKSTGRGDVALLHFRRTLFRVLQESITESGIDWNACHVEDLGDGMKVVFPINAVRKRLVHPLLHELTIRLRAHNKLAGSSTRVRVRAALHAGDVHLDDGRLAGGSLAMLARLLDAPPLRDALDRAPESAPVAALLSQHVYDEVVRHGYPGIDLDAYRRVQFTVKETTTFAWLHIPGLSFGRAPEPTQQQQQQPAAGATYSQTNNATNGGRTFSTQTGDLNLSGKDFG
ncbi:hypothetical protein D5S17_05335 [Pseudonocardiaceae bacterium YIM PH 21723]|nr:hypothetical protein D5S17_05335 [Pseudonocardiaceae bacterium YIM PH 21723]